MLKRHATGHAHDRDRKRKRSSSVAKQSRVSQACKACASSKLKCDEEKPCRRCRERSLHCDWQDVVQESSPEPQQQSSTENSHPIIPGQPLALAASVAFSPMPTPMDDFSAGPRSGGILMTPHAPPPEPPVISPEVPPTGEQMPMEYGGKRKEPCDHRANHPSARSTLADTNLQYHPPTRKVGFSVSMALFSRTSSPTP